MTGNAINAKSDALVRDLSSEELDAVSGGFIQLPLVAYKVPAPKARLRDWLAAPTAGGAADSFVVESALT